MREITINFNVTGTCCQTIKINDECELTDEEIITELNMGGLITETHEGGFLRQVTGFHGLNVIGYIDGSDMSCEYEDFKDVSPKEEL